MLTYSIGYLEVYRRFQGRFFLVVGGGWVRVYVGGSFHEGSFHGGRDIAIKGTPDFPALFKKRSEIKYKKRSFSTATAATSKL